MTGDSWHHQDMNENGSEDPLTLRCTPGSPRPRKLVRGPWNGQQRGGLGLGSKPLLVVLDASFKLRVSNEVLGLRESGPEDGTQFCKLFPVSFDPLWCRIVRQLGCHASLQCRCEVGTGHPLEELGFHHALKVGSVHLQRATTVVGALRTKVHLHGVPLVEGEHLPQAPSADQQAGVELHWWTTHLLTGSALASPVEGQETVPGGHVDDGWPLGRTDHLATVLTKAGDPGGSEHPLEWPRLERVPSRGDDASAVPVVEHDC